MFRRLQARLDRIERQTHNTMQQAQDSMERVSVAVVGLTETVRAITEEVLDGFSVEIEPAERTGPTKVRLILKEEGDEGDDVASGHDRG